MSDTSARSHPASDLRQFLAQLEREAPEELARVKRRVSPRFEISAILTKLEASRRYPALYCPEVEGSPYPVVSNLMATRRRLALALGVAESDLNGVYRQREEHPIPPRLVDDAPVKEVRFVGEKVDLTRLPVLTHGEKDAGPCITAGAVVVKDPETGTRNVGIYRLQLKGPSELCIYLSEASHARLIFERYARRKQPMELAIAVGHHPAFYLAAASTVPLGADEYAIAGGLLGTALRIARCETVDLEVPADAEMAIEGTIATDERDWEGPLGELAGLYGQRTLSPVIHVTAMTARARAIYQDVFAGHLEHRLLSGTPRLSTIYRMVEMACPTVRDVHMPPSGFCRFVCYIAAAFAADPSIKYCVVLDDDVDIFDDEQVLMAVTSRLRPERDAFMIRRALGNPVDPSADEDRLVTKVGIDATRPLSGFPETAQVPGAGEIDLEQYL